MSETSEGVEEAEFPEPTRPGQTHYEGCWKTPGHHNCAVARANNLLKQLKEAEEDRDGMEGMWRSASRRADEHEKEARATQRRVAKLEERVETCLRMNDAIRDRLRELAGAASEARNQISRELEHAPGFPDAVRGWLTRLRDRLSAALDSREDEGEGRYGRDGRETGDSEWDAPAYGGSPHCICVYEPVDSEGQQKYIRVEAVGCPEHDPPPVHADEPEGDEPDTRAEPGPPRCESDPEGYSRCDRRAGHDGPHRDYFGKEWPTDEAVSREGERASNPPCICGHSLAQHHWDEAGCDICDCVEWRDHLGLYDHDPSDLTFAGRSAPTPNDREGGPLDELVALLRVDRRDLNHGHTVGKYACRGCGPLGGELSALDCLDAKHVVYGPFRTEPIAEKVMGLIDHSLRDRPTHADEPEGDEKYERIGRKAVSAVRSFDNDKHEIGYQVREAVFGEFDCSADDPPTDEPVSRGWRSNEPGLNPLRPRDAVDRIRRHLQDLERDLQHGDAPSFDKTKRVVGDCIGELVKIREQGPATHADARSELPSAYYRMAAKAIEAKADEGWYRNEFFARQVAHAFRQRLSIRPDTPTEGPDDR